MPPTTRRTDQKTVQRKGTIAALVLAAGCVGTVGFFVARALMAQPEWPVEDLTETGIVIRPGEELAPGAPVGGEKIRIKLADKEDPTRRAGQLVVDSMDPLEGHRYAVTKPDAWIYMKDGSAIHVRAAGGTLYMPDAQTPESGAISGGVEIDVYAARADGEVPSAEADKPAQSFRTDSIAFDAALGEAATEDAFTHLAFAEGGTDLLARMSATGFKIVMDEANQRLVRFAINSGGRLEAWDGGQSKRDRKPEAPKPPAAQQVTVARPPGAPTPAAPAPKPVETLYAMTFGGGVNVRVGTGELRSEELRAWARLLDNKLPENAIAEVKFREAKAKSEQAEPRPAADRPRAAPSVAVVPATPSGEAAPDLVLTWDGFCNILPTEAAAPALAKDHVAMRFTGAEGVAFSDPESGASGSAAAIDYGLTSRTLAFSGTPEAHASIQMAENGGISSGLIRADLGTGIIHTTGGELRGGEDTPLTIAWTEQADFTLRVIEGELTNQIQQAVIQGGVRGEDEGGLMTADFARAEFAPAGDDRTELSRLILENSAKLRSGDSGSLSGDAIDVAFARGDGKTPQPVTLTATGNVFGERDGDELHADFLEAQLAKNPKGATDVTLATARGAVRFLSEKDQATAAAGELKVDLSWEPNAPVIDGRFDRKQTADLTGAATLTKDGRTTISGSQMRLDGIARSLRIFGAGSFDHKDAQDRRLAAVHATWKRGMFFDDSAGTVECDGETVAESSSSPNAVDTLRSERLKIWISPRDTPLPPGIQVAVGDSDRPLLKAEAIGGMLIREGGGNASIESRRYVEDAAATDGRRVEQLYYMEGPRIIADNIAQTVEVPDAGRMVMQDQRPEAEKAEMSQPTLGFGPSSARGSALLDWDGSLRMDRKAGLLDVRRNVRLTHSALDEARTATNLVCEKLIAKIREVGNSLADAGAKAELVSATASGAVYVTSGPEVTAGAPRPPTKELVADGVEYDAVNQTVTAAAAPGNTVMLFDPKSPTPVSAGRLFWNLRTDRIEIKDPGPVAMPANADMQR